ncbi:6258_t:CDS:2 [Cetraspora pellucida]|uniref:6258_t:CDS:1 n=1 Tax=Cetraspora pellucida TaxID=1433469 RepID=A0A9N9IEW9_9GLOM|nr:6258_t:CDS:2 [Cetraspora pellucida]
MANNGTQLTYPWPTTDTIQELRFPAISQLKRISIPTRAQILEQRVSLIPSLFQKLSTYKDFRINLVWSLIKESLEMNKKLYTRRKSAMIQSELHNQSSEKRPFYVTKKFELPIE